MLQARSAADVRAAVLWSARNDVRIAARSGGHSYAGYSTLNGGLVVDLSALNGIAVSADRRTVQVGAGARLIDVYTALARRGADRSRPARAPPSASAAWRSGGGVGLASRALGTTCDNIAALTVVTADGRALECDARRNADLFWACRGGGGGNFGIATGFTFTTHRVSSASYFFASFPWSRAADVDRAPGRRWAPHAPDELFSICSLSTGALAARVSTSSASTWASEARPAAHPARPHVGPARRAAHGGAPPATSTSCSAGPAAWASRPPSAAARRASCSPPSPTTC